MKKSAKKMKTKYEVNKLILEKIEKSDSRDNVKEFLKDVIAFERSNMTKERVNYSDFYNKRIASLSSKS